LSRQPLRTVDHLLFVSGSKAIGSSEAVAIIARYTAAFPSSVSDVTKCPEALVEAVVGGKVDFWRVFNLVGIADVDVGGTGTGIPLRFHSSIERFTSSVISEGSRLKMG